MNEEQSTNTTHWAPVQSELTHCYDVEFVQIKSAEYDGELHTTRMPYVKASPTKYFKSVRMRILAHDHMRSVRNSLIRSVEVTFNGCVHFSLSQFVWMSPNDQIRGEDLRTKESYDFRTIRNSGIVEYDGFLDHGAFCLWVSDDTPLVRRLIKPWTNDDNFLNVEQPFRHYKLMCDRVGTYEIVAVECIISPEIAGTSDSDGV